MAGAAEGDEGFQEGWQAFFPGAAAAEMRRQGPRHQAHLFRQAGGPGLAADGDRADEGESHGRRVGGQFGLDRRRRRMPPASGQ